MTIATPLYIPLSDEAVVDFGYEVRRRIDHAANAIRGIECERD